MGSTADQYQDRPAGLLLWFVLVCRQIAKFAMRCVRGKYVGYILSAQYFAKDYL